MLTDVWPLYISSVSKTKIDNFFNNSFSDIEKKQNVTNRQNIIMLNRMAQLLNNVSGVAFSFMLLYIGKKYINALKDGILHPEL